MRSFGPVGKWVLRTLIWFAVFVALSAFWYSRNHNLWAIFASFVAFVVLAAGDWISIVGTRTRKHRSRADGEDTRM